MGRSFIYIRNNKGVRTVPCGTPESINHDIIFANNCVVFTNNNNHDKQ